MNIINATAAQTAVTPSSPTTTTGSKGAYAKVAIVFLTRSSDADLVVAINRIIASMTGNAIYPAPAPTLAEVSAAQATYVQAVNTLDRGRPAQIRRNDARAAVVALVRDLSLYVQHTCQGDLAGLVSSGFSAQRNRHRPLGVLPPPPNLRLSVGKLSGQLRAQCGATRAAGSYQWRYATEQAPTAWTLSNPTTSSRYTLAGLVPGTSYLVQVRAVGALGASDWSDSATLISM
jgi:hypothetical protein